MNRYKRLLSNTAIFAIGTFSSKVMVYLLMPLYTEILSKSQYSVSDLVANTANLLMPLAAVGICDGIFRFALDAGDDKTRVFSSGIVTMLLSTGVFLLMSPILMLFQYFDGYVWLIIIYVIAANFQLACANYIRALGHTKVFAAQGILNTALTVGFNILFLVVFDMGVTGYVLSVVVANAIVTVVLVFTMKLYRDIKPSYIDRDTARNMLKYSVPMIPTAIFWWMTSVSGRFVVEHYCGNDINGMFAAAYKIPTVITLLTTIFIEAWQYSAVTDTKDAGNDRADFFGSVFKSYMGLIFTAAACLITTSKIFTQLLLADSYYEAWQFMPPLIIAMVFSALTTFMGSVYMVKKKSVLSFLTSLTGAVFNLSLSLVLVPIIGAQGAAVAAIISYLAVFIIRTVSTRKFVRFNVHPFKLAVNMLIIAAQCLIMLTELKYFYIFEIVLTIAMIALNIRSILDGVMLAFRKKRNN